MAVRRLLWGVFFCSVCSSSAFAEIYKQVELGGRVVYTDQRDPYNKRQLLWSGKGWVERSPNTWAVKFRARQRRYTHTIAHHAKKSGVSKELVHAVITAESAYRVHAISKAGAVGLMQLMPQTAKRYGVKNSHNAEENIRGGSQYLSDLLEMFNDNIVLAVAAYNAGENAVKLYNNSIPPYPETRRYVKKVLKYYHQYKKK